MDSQDRRGLKRLYLAVLDAPEPSWRGYIGHLGSLAIVGAGFAVYHRAWLVVVAAVMLAAVALPVTVWLQGREPTESEVELPPIAIHVLYPWTIIGPGLLLTGIVIADLALTVLARSRRP